MHFHSTAQFTYRKIQMIKDVMFLASKQHYVQIMQFPCLNFAKASSLLREALIERDSALQNKVE